MFGSELRLWITSLLPAEAVGLIRSLLLAEANRLRCGTGAVRMSGNLTAPDAGVDARTHFPEGSESIFPIGPCTWQVKAGQSGEPNITAELAKAGVKHDIEQGRRYVLAWTQDPAATSTLEERLEAAVGDQGGEGVLARAEDVERFCRVHPAVVQALGGPSLFGLAMSGWEATFDLGLFPFVTDERRAGHVEQVRQFAESIEAEVTHLHLFGDTGVGKSRLTFEALNQDGLRERVIVAPDINSVDQTRLSQIVRSNDAYLVLVVDDCTWEDASSLEKFAGAAEGRVRLITIGDRPSRETRPQRASLDIGPLSEGVVTELVTQISGIQEEHARLIAEIAQGFPKLAVELARSLREAGPATIADLLHHHRVEALLQRMLPNEQFRRNIAHLALFDRLGFDGELSFETELLCRTFELDEIAFRSAVETETGRFVSTAGRYRRATPKAFAVWLVRDIVRADPGGFTARLGGLPQELFEAFRRQIEILGGDPLMDSVLEEVVARRAEWFRGEEGLTSEGARLLNALAFAVPELASNEIHRIVTSGSIDDLRELDGDRRRELVWALDHLMWFEATFEQAAESLLRLAVAENENYANNARGTLAGAFQVHLGGTEVPYDRRISWLRSHANDLGMGSLREAIEAVDSAFTVHETRMGGWRGARMQPAEWRPATREQDLEARRLAWRFIADAYLEHPDAEEVVVAALASGARALVEWGLGPEFLQWLRSQQWSDASRARLAGALRQTLTYGENLPSDLTELVQGALASLEGDTLEARLSAIALTDYWELAETLEEKREGPQILLDLADEAIRENAIDHLRAAQAQEGAKSHTVYELFRRIGSGDSRGLFQDLAMDPTVSSPARVGYVSGRGRQDEAWLNELLHEWLQIPELAADAPAAVSGVPATPERVALAVEAVNMGRATLRELNAFMYGGWAHGLPAETIELLLKTYLARDPEEDELDAVMSLLSFWIGAGNSATHELRSLGQALIGRAAVLERDRVGLDYVRNALSSQLGIDADVRLDVLLQALKRVQHPSAEDIVTLGDLAETEPSKVVPAVIEFLLSDEEGWSLYLQSSHVLTLLGQRAGSHFVAGEIQSLALEKQIRLLSHIDFTSADPDPIFVELFELSGNKQEFQEAAASRYLFPGEVVSGSYSYYLERRKEQAIRWAEVHPILEEWAASVASSIDSWIENERLQEEERGY